MNFKLLSILLIISVYTEAKQFDLKRHKIQYETLEDSIRNGDTAKEKLRRSDVNLLLNITFLVDENPMTIAQELLALETTSSDFWVVSPSCKSAFCKNKPGVNGNDNDEPLTAENGLVRGYLGTLQITVGTYFVGYANFTSADYVDRAVEKRMSSSAAGALGLGPNNALMDALSPQNVISLQVNPSRGTLYIGEIPNISPSAIKTRIRSMSQSSWKISLGHITSSTPPFKSWCNEGCVAEIDTTFSGISGPAKDINDLNAYIGADEDGSIDCYKNKLIDPVIFHINGQRYKLEAKNFIIKEDREKDPYSNKCKSQFQVEYSYNGAWRLGLAFLQQFTTAFEYEDDSIFQYVSFIEKH